MPARIIDEPIEVIAHFDEEEIHPLQFKWRDKAYKIFLNKLKLKSIKMLKMAL